MQTSKIYFTTGSTFLQSAERYHNQLLPAGSNTQGQLHALKIPCQLEKDCASSNSKFMACMYMHGCNEVEECAEELQWQAAWLLHAGDASLHTYANNCLLMPVLECQHACWHMLPPGRSPLLDGFFDLRKKCAVNGSFQARLPNDKLVVLQFAFQEILHVHILPMGFANVLSRPQCPGLLQTTDDSMRIYQHPLNKLAFSWLSAIVSGDSFLMLLAKSSACFDRELKGPPCHRRQRIAAFPWRLLNQVSEYRVQ